MKKIEYTICTRFFTVRSSMDIKAIVDRYGKLKVFPLTVSICTSGPNEGKKSLSNIPSEWQVPREYPNEVWEKANAVGLITGKVNHLLVVDIDDPDPINYLKSLAIPDEVTKTRCVRTRSGGMHLYYIITPEKREMLECSPGENIHNGSHVVINGQKSKIDIRADDGFVIAPPTVLPDGTAYTWYEDNHIVAVHDFWIQCLTHSSVVTIEDREDWISPELVCAATDKEERERFKKMYDYALKKKVPLGKRSEHDYFIACAGLSSGVSEFDVYEAIKATSSKYAEKQKNKRNGNAYLKLTIDNAKKEIVENRKKEVEARKELKELDGKMIRIKCGEKYATFSSEKIWRTEVSGPVNAPKIEYRIDFWKLQKHMETNGVLLSTQSNNRDLLKVSGHIIDSLDVEGIKPFYLSYIKELTTKGYLKSVSTSVAGSVQTHDVGEMLYHSVVDHNDLSPTKIEDMAIGVVVPDCDTRDEIHIPFTDLWLSITKDGYAWHEYADLGACIPRASIISYEPTIDTSPGMWSDLVSKICGGDAERIYGLQTAFGYLLSRYNDPAKMVMVVLSDQTDSISPCGGTCKSLLLSALHIVRPHETALIDGKTFDPSNRFAWQDAHPATRTIILDDLKRNFDFEPLFHAITGGLSIEQKYKKMVKLDKMFTPKMCATTNYSVTNLGYSSERRLAEFEIVPYFGKDRTPQAEYGCSLISSDWSKTEWAKFFGWVVQCAQAYIKDGLLVPKTHVMLNVRKALDGTSTEWIDYCTNHIAINRIYPTKVIVNDFMNEYPEVMHRINISHHLIHSWAEHYSTSCGYMLYRERKRVEGLGRVHTIAFGDGTVDYDKMPIRTTMYEVQVEPKNPTPATPTSTNTTTTAEIDTNNIFN